MNVEGENIQSIIVRLCKLISTDNDNATGPWSTLARKELQQWFSALISIRVTWRIIIHKVLALTSPQHLLNCQVMLTWLVETILEKHGIRG